MCRHCARIHHRCSINILGLGGIMKRDCAIGRNQYQFLSLQVCAGQCYRRKSLKTLWNLCVFFSSQNSAAFKPEEDGILLQALSPVAGADLVG